MKTIIQELRELLNKHEAHKTDIDVGSFAGRLAKFYCDVEEAVKRHEALQAGQE